MNVGGKPLKAPFPYAGGKSRVADMVWSRFGNVDNYVEPFAGSLAILLRRPADHFRGGYRAETVNDLNHYVVNFWRAVKADPEKVAEHADWPVTEADLHARHKWLVRSEESAEWRERMRTDPHAFDAKIAGYWCWGACCWIGGAWCHADFVDRNMRPAMYNNGSQGWGVNAAAEDGHQSRPQLCDRFDIGRGVNSGGNLPRDKADGADNHKRPNLGGEFNPGKGVVALAAHGTCDARLAWLVDWMRRLADRLRLVRTCYGHWSRVCDSDSTLTRLGRTGVFLDPPYPAISTNGEKSRDPSLYATDRHADLNALRDEVLEWCRTWGRNDQLAVAVCGYEGDGYESLLTDGWSEQAWEASGGYANQRRKGKKKSDNAKRERIWFSPACPAADIAPGLFDDCDGTEAA